MLNVVYLRYNPLFLKVILQYILFFVLSIHFTFAQQPVSIHLTEKDGLPDNEFYNILEDSKGYVWLAANKGLFRFDGTEYKKFQHPKQIGLSVFQLQEAENGAIWCINLYGQVFNIQDEKITLFQDYNAVFKGHLPNLRIENDLLILATSENVILVNTKTKKNVFKEKYNGAFYLEPTIYNKTLYYGVFGNLIKLNLQTFEKTTIPFITKDKQTLQQSSISKLGEDFVFHINDRNGLKFYSLNAKFNTKSNELAHNFPNTRIVTSKVIDNKLWYCTKNGVFVCDIIESNLVIKRHLFKNQFITDIVKDKHDNYWFTSVNNSIFIVPNIEINQVDIPLNNDKISLTQKGNKNELLINTLKYNFYKYSFPSEKTKFYTFKSNPEVYFSKYINNKYFVYTNRNTYAFNASLKNPNILRTEGSIKDLQVIDSKFTLIAYSNRIKVVSAIDHKKIFDKKIRGYKVFYDAENELIYFATVDGLIVLDKDLKEKQIRFNNIAIYINGITQTKDGVLWCSSFKNGLFAIKNNKVIDHITETEGLLSNSNSYIKAKENNIWIAGDNGIQYYSTKEKIFNNLTKNEGIVSYNYNGLEIIDNNVFVSSPEQIIYFNEEDVFKPYNAPEVFFTNVSIDNEKQVLKDNYTLKEETSNVSVNYSSIGFKTNVSGQFEYRLLGFNENWIATKNGITNVQYNSLLEGNYTFQVRNITTDKTASKTKQITFIVTKPFWEKWWFYLLLLSLLLILITFFYRNQLNKREQEKNKLLKQLEVDKELINLKLENLRSQMNPHFVFNALNSIQEYIMSNQKDLAGDYLGKFADLIRTYLEHSTKGKITLEEELNTLNMYLELEKLRFEDTLEYTVNSSNNIDEEAIYIPTMLVQPYAENALKHGLFHKTENRKLTILVSKISNEAIECIIEDNGVGRQRSNEINKKRAANHQSFALKATSERLNLLNYRKEKKIGVAITDLFDSNNKATGTKVILTIPIIKN